jgi:hypothetical protein
LGGGQVGVCVGEGDIRGGSVGDGNEGDVRGCGVGGGNEGNAAVVGLVDMQGWWCWWWWWWRRCKG